MLLIALLLGVCLAYVAHVALERYRLFRRGDGSGVRGGVYAPSESEALARRAATGAFRQPRRPLKRPHVRRRGATIISYLSALALAAWFSSLTGCAPIAGAVIAEHAAQSQPQYDPAKLAIAVFACVGAAIAAGNTCYLPADTAAKSKSPADIISAIQSCAGAGVGGGLACKSAIDFARIK